ncbi:hypothetical protein [Halochromatium glycolicum]|uniref:Uncharacterized protein n=1 Tax=Halochromatium glycolicum TaxID=85075 RepID=A0AAJ0U8A9_9GAMM|nr:hypothetical protein [Halochromatium glycolicum]MBK1707175.1 hypothetical protein [Halochromatium glycolicum]
MSTDSPAEPSEERLRQWHRLFGIALMDLFEGAPWRVELEQELALRSQLLDVAIIEATGEVEATGEGAQRSSVPQPPLELPDGLENLRPHNLLTYKSRHEPLNAWTLDELIGHYVNDRKLRLDRKGERHRESAFGLYAVATRFPRDLVRTHPLQPTNWEGVYELRWGGHRVRVIVLNAIAQHPRNAAWELFACEQDRMRQGLIHYRARHPHSSQGGHWALLEHLYLIYQQELPDMAYTMEDFIRETHELVIKDALKRRDPAEILKHYAPEERLKGLDPEERLKGLDPATIEAWLAKQHRDH